MATKKRIKRKLKAAQRKAGDALIRREAGKNAVDCLLKSSLNPAFTKYEIHGLSDGTALYVNISKMLYLGCLALALLALLAYHSRLRCLFTTRVRCLGATTRSS